MHVGTRWTPGKVLGEGPLPARTARTQTIAVRTLLAMPARPPPCCEPLGVSLPCLASVASFGTPPTHVTARP